MLEHGASTGVRRVGGHQRSIEAWTVQKGDAGPWTTSGIATQDSEM